MKPVNETFHAFDPQQADRQIPQYLPSGVLLVKHDAGRTMAIRLPDQPLEFRDLGRLLILNGKCRQVGIKLVLECSPATARQLSQCQIDRLIWTEDQTVRGRHEKGVPQDAS